MAEARERAAKAEAEADFLREKLKNTRQQLDEVKKKKILEPRCHKGLSTDPMLSCLKTSRQKGGGQNRLGPGPRDGPGRGWSRKHGKHAKCVKCGKMGNLGNSGNLGKVG